LLFFVEESESGEFTNIPLIKELIRKKEEKISLSLPLNEENKNTENYPTNDLSYKNEIKDMNITYSLNKKIIVEDLVFNDTIPCLGIAPENGKSPRSNSINFNIMINSSINNTNLDKNEPEIRFPKCTELTQNNTVNINEVKGNLSERTNSVIIKKRIKKSKKPSIHNCKNYIEKKDILQLDNKGIKEFFELIRQSGLTQNNIFSKQVDDKCIVNFIKLYLINMTNSKNNGLIEYIKKNDAFFNSLFHDLYLIINKYVQENWKWIDKNNAANVSFRVFVLILTQLINDDFHDDFFARKDEKHFSNTYNMSILENLREKMLADSINKLIQTNHIESIVKHDYEKETSGKINEKESKNLNDEYNNCFEKIQTKFLGYKYILKNLADL
jgi:hypothetical protein